MYAEYDRARKHREVIQRMDIERLQNFVAHPEQFEAVLKSDQLFRDLLEKRSLMKMVMKEPILMGYDSGVYKDRFTQMFFKDGQWYYQKLQKIAPEDLKKIRKKYERHEQQFTECIV